jgi:hypothetical protein
VVGGGHLDMFACNKSGMPIKISAEDQGPLFICCSNGGCSAWHPGLLLH